MSDYAPELITYLIKYDVSSFFHLSKDCIQECSLIFFSLMLGVKIGLNLFRRILEI